MPSVQDHSTTPLVWSHHNPATAVPAASESARPLPREEHRRLTRIEALAAGIATGLLAVAERLAVAVVLDRRQAAELRLVRLALSQIVLIGHPASANLARVGLHHASLADAADRDRDEHVSTCRALVRFGRRCVRGIGRLIERATVGRARPEEE